MDNLLLDLRNKIERKLLPLINNDYIFYGLPYYSNIGDVLIWEGTRQFLSKCCYKCLDSFASSSIIREPISQDTIIIITGGGFWGDVWRKSFEYALLNIKNKYTNRIIFFPNSIFYNDKCLLEKDVDFLRNYKDLYICCRDSFSYDFAKRYFKNNIMLVPDMAFYIDPLSISVYKIPYKRNILLLQRNDCEMSSKNRINGADVHDWPTMESLSFHMFFYKSFFKIFFFLSSYSFFDKKKHRKLVNYIGSNFFRIYMLKNGVRFISKYKVLVTTRLHPMILAFLLNKKVFYIDNSYGKISHLYDTWLKDAKTVSKYVD